MNERRYYIIAQDWSTGTADHLFRSDDEYLTKDEAEAKATEFNTGGPVSYSAQAEPDPEEIEELERLATEADQFISRNCTY